MVAGRCRAYTAVSRLSHAARGRVVSQNRIHAVVRSLTDNDYDYTVRVTVGGYTSGGAEKPNHLTIIGQKCAKYFTTL